MNFPILINWPSPFFISRVSGVHFFHFYHIFDRNLGANSVDPDQTSSVEDIDCLNICNAAIIGAYLLLMNLQRLVLVVGSDHKHDYDETA